MQCRCRLLAMLAAAHAQSTWTPVSPNPAPLPSLNGGPGSPPRPPNAPVCITPSICIQPIPELRISILSPPAGPLEGGTKLVLIGDGFRDFGPLMRCRFGAAEVPMSLTRPPGGYIDPYNHTHLGCEVPQAPTPMPQSVSVEVTLNGDDYSSSGAQFRYYRQPQVTAVSPSRGSAARPQAITLTRSTADDSGVWQTPGDPPSKMRCRFEAITQPDGKRQIPFVQEVNASRIDDTELVCHTPVVTFVAPVRVDVSLNGQQYATGGPTFDYEDNWHSPEITGTAPARRHGHASARVGSLVYLFGGEDGDLFGGDGFLRDLYALNLDTMTDFYPSATARDLTWQHLGITAGGELPSPRSYATLAPWAGTLLLFGGMSSVNGDMHNSTFAYHISRGLWEQLPVAGGPIRPRAGHTALVCTLADGCASPGGRPRLLIYGGWGLSSCGYGLEQCLMHKSDLHALDLISNTWTEIAPNAEQPRPPSRKGHSATLVNGTTMLIFGGSAWVPDAEADNSFGYTTRHVNDLWAIDVSGRDGYTWHAVHSVGDAPAPREGHGAALLAGRYLAIFGGYGFDIGYSNETYVLDTALDPMVWTRPTMSGTVPTGRHGHTMLALGEDYEILTFGGMGRAGYRNDVHILQVGVGNTRQYPGLAVTGPAPPAAPP